MIWADLPQHRELRHVSLVLPQPLHVGGDHDPACRMSTAPVS
jgi:hypothetical protein